MSDGVQQLQERIEATAMEHNVTTAHAVGLVWYEEGSNQNVYNAEEWAAVFAMLLGGGEGNAA